MGVPAEKASTVAEFRPALDRALEARGPYLLDIDMAALHPMAALPAGPAQSRR
jgi:thiamine pyrophosphate-dependent acetolactate synthase large subunit-like protein